MLENLLRKHIIILCHQILPKRDYPFFGKMCEFCSIMSDKRRKRRRARKKITLIVSRARNTSLIFPTGLGARICIVSAYTLLDRKEIWKEKESWERKRETRETSNEFNGIARNPENSGRIISPRHRRALPSRRNQIFPLFIRSRVPAVTSRLISYWFLAARY